MNKKGSKEKLKHGHVRGNGGSRVHYNSIIVCRGVCYGQGSDGGEKTVKSQTLSVDLPPELLEEIYKRLVLSDQIRFGCICKAWFSIASQKPHPLVPDPWLMLGRGLNDMFSKRNEFLCLSDKRVYRFDKLIPNDCKVLVSSSSNGWVLTTTHLQLKGVGRTIILMNPILNFGFLLPKHSPVYHFPCTWTWPRLVKKHLVVRTRSSCGTSVLTILFLLSSNGQLVVYWQDDHRPCSDLRHEGICRYDDIIFFYGKLYALASPWPGFELHVFCLDGQTMCLHFQRSYVVRGIVTISPKYQTCLAESGEDLLIVRRQYNHVRRSAGFEVFKLAPVDGSDCSVQAIKLQSLAGRALFLGMDGCISLLVGKFSMFKENHIYFIGYISERKEMEHGVYSLENGGIKRIPILSSIFCPSGSFWFFPTSKDMIVDVDWDKRNQSAI